MHGSLKIAARAFSLAVVVSVGAAKGWQADSSAVATYQITLHQKATYDGGPVREADLFKAQRSNGDAIEESDNIRGLQLYSRGLLVSIDSLRHNRMTSGTGKPTVFPPHPFGPNCESYAAEMTGESKTILGFKTLHVAGKPQIQTTEDGDTLTNTEDTWVSPDLGCQALEETSTFAVNDALNTTTKIATSATREPPPDSMFEIPTGYPEVPPSLFWGAMGRGFSQRQEDHYNRQKAKRAEQ